MTSLPHKLLLEGWTAGAQRALIRAAQMARIHAASQVEPLHLLWSLVFDEGRAGARLESHGLSRESIVGPTPLLGFLQDLATRYESADATLPWGEEALEITAAALQQAFEEQPNSEAGTDHLLWSLCRARSPVADLLHGYGLGPTTWEPVRAAPTTTDHPPMSIAAELQLSPRERSAANPVEVLRIVDAAANRAREGLRVIEDYVRFALNDGFLARTAKECRHDLAAALLAFPQSELLASRDTPGDVGTHVATATEYQRTNFTDVLTAACKRTEEALRSLEEYGKVVDGLLGGRFEQLRYRLYTLEKAVLRTQFNRERLAEQKLYLLVTEALCPTGSGPVVHAALQAGVRLFQLREKRMKDRELVERCRWLRRVTREADALLIINDRPDLAAIVDADGVHVGQDELTVVDARKIVGPEKLVGVSTHSIEQARQAVLDGADYIGVGPTFPSGTKDFASFPGLSLVRAVAAEIGLPWFAIGGINADNVVTVRGAGAQRVAVCGAVCGAQHPADVIQKLLERL